MPNLYQIQTLFQDYILKGEEGIAGHIVGDAIKTDERLKIYFDGYRIKLVDVLKSDFPKLYCYIGKEKFEALCLAYLKQYASEHFSVRYVGQYLIPFLVHSELFVNNPEVVELVKLEWILDEALDSLDAKALTAAGLKKIAPELWSETCFSLHPSVRVITLNTNVDIIWTELHQEKQNISAVEHYSEPKHLLIWRDQEMQLYFKPLDAIEACFVRSLQEQQSFAQVCENLCQHCDAEQVPNKALSILQHLITDECLIL